MLPLLLVLAGVLAGGAVAWFFQESRHAVHHARATTLGEQADLARGELAAERQAFNLERQTHVATNARLAAAEERVRGLELQQAETNERLRAEFESLANRVLEEKGARFTTQNQHNLNALLAPLGQKITEFKSEVQRAREEDHRVRGRLEEQIRTVAVTGERMTREANTLASALKGSTKTQGNWGELILESVLQSCGLTRGSHYRVQANVKGDDGSDYRPDVIVDLPDGKQIIVDSKVSLTHYERWCRAGEANNERERDIALRGHLDSLRGHISGLGAKGYHKARNVQTVGFVLMFVPVEPALTVACGADGALLDEALRKNVCLVTPATLLLALRLVEGIWKQEKQTRNADEIAQKSGALLDQFARFCEDLEGVSVHLGKAKEAHDSAVKRLTTGNGNLLRRTEELRTLGAKASKQPPVGWSERAAVELGPPLGSPEMLALQ